MATNTTDNQFLERSLGLARLGVGLASPNPYVGAVIVDAGGKISGEGTFRYADVQHAEILALEQSGPGARGGTLYINLEPHAHQGRTPPCTDALIAAGIKRVVASMADPNPRVSGRGFAQLRAAGIEVVVGGLEEQARRLNESFARYIRQDIPLVTLKSAMTLDGKIAAGPRAQENSGETQASRDPARTWITGEAARMHVHQLRHQHDAILVGIGTVIADDPLLTDRSRLPRRRPLLRIILDSHLRLPEGSQLVRSVQAAGEDLLVFCSSLPANEKKKAQWKERGVRVEHVATDGKGKLDLGAILRLLGKLEITSLMIEGGSAVNGAALAAGIVDKMFLYYAPKVFAGEGTVPFTTGLDSGGVGSTHLKSVQLHRFGDDIAVEGYVRDPYE